MKEDRIKHSQFLLNGLKKKKLRGIGNRKSEETILQKKADVKSKIDLLHFMGLSHSFIKDNDINIINDY